MAPIEWPEIAPTVTSGWSMSAWNAASASAPNSPALSGSSSAGLAPFPRTSKVRQWKPAAWRKATIGRVRSRADSQPWTRTTPGPRAPSRAGMNQAGSASPPDSMSIDSYGNPRSAGVIRGGLRCGNPARTL